MILTIDLKPKEVNKIDLYKAIEYLWLNEESVTQYDDMAAFHADYKTHIEDEHPKGKNYVAVIDTVNKHFEVVNIIMGAQPIKEEK